MSQSPYLLLIMNTDTFKGLGNREQLERLSFPSPLLGFYSMLQGYCLHRNFWIVSFPSVSSIFKGTSNNQKSRTVQITFTCFKDLLFSFIPIC
jgi:hypothetical protein